MNNEKLRVKNEKYIDVGEDVLKFAPNNHAITLIALVITMVFFYDKLKKCSNSNSFLLLGI